jgi:glycosyltransferase involved in cell wall biosynthesis
MDSLVSVIVPTYNSAAYLEECLRSIRQQSYPRVELIVVDNNSVDDTKRIAARYADQVFNRGPERSAQRNHGAQASKGEYLLVIDSDMVLSERVVASCVEEMERTGCRAIVVPEVSFGQGFWARCKELERSFYVGVPWMEAARFFRRAAFEEAGGYDEKNTGTEDYDLPQRIEHQYGPSAIGRVSEPILHNEQKLSLVRTCRKKFYYAQKVHVYETHDANRGKFAMQSSPLQRYKLFFSSPRKLFARPLVGAGMVFMKTCEFASGAAGYIVGRMARR